LRLLVLVVAVTLLTCAVAFGEYRQAGGQLDVSVLVPSASSVTPVALSGDGSVAVVGALSADGDVGAVVVFVRAASGWVQQVLLTANDETGPGCFGSSVGISADGRTVVVGGAQDNGFEGGAWVFTRTGSTWAQDGPRLVPSDATVPTAGGAYDLVAPGSEFGASVAISGDGATVLIGGPYDGKGASGAAWVFTRAGGAWIQQGPKLTPSDATGRQPCEGESAQGFGASVALYGNGNSAIIGDPAENFSVACGIGVSIFDGCEGWMFTRSGAAWTQDGPKLPDGTETLFGSGFGTAVAMSADGSTALLGGAVIEAVTLTESGWVQQDPDLGSGASEPGSLGLSADRNTLLRSEFALGRVGVGASRGPARNGSQRFLEGVSCVRDNPYAGPRGSGEGWLVYAGASK
jgi:hypothetical protein